MADESEEDILSSSRYTAKITAVAALITVALFTVLSALLIHSHWQGKQTLERYVHFQELIGKIVHMDEVLTMSARMSAVSGDKVWEERYLSVEPQLDAAIQEAERVSGEVYSGQDVSQIDAANIELVNIEHQVFELIRQQRLEDARALIFNENYKQQKKIYAEGINLLKEGVRDAENGLLAKEHKHVVWSVAGVLVVLPLLLGFAFYIFRVIRTWQNRLIESHRMISSRTEELATLNLTLERRVAERTARLNLQDTALRATANGVVITTRDGTIVWVNPAFSQITGYTPEEVIGNNPRILKSGKQDQDMYQDLWDTILEGRVWRGELVNQRKDGSHYVEEQTITPVRSNGGEITHFIAIKNNITERKEIERFKDDFIYIIPHELRTPLTSIEQGVEMLRDGLLGSLTPEGLSVVGVISQDLDRLRGVIEKTELVEKLMLGRVDYLFKPFDLTQVMSQLEVTYKHTAESRKQQFLVECGARTAPCIGDASQLSVALSEVIDNALKVTPEGGAITLRCSAVKADWQIDVEDTGPGISEQELSNLCSRFQSIGGLGERKTGGLGVGLYIAKSIIIEHGGSISAMSIPGRGTRMTIKIPSVAKQEASGTAT